jgi:hypothetical protein
MLQVALTDVHNFLIIMNQSDRIQTICTRNAELLMITG